jgi:hypothetical protein
MQQFVDNGMQTVIACFYGSRDPGHWQKRA